MGPPSFQSSFTGDFLSLPVHHLYWAYMTRETPPATTAFPQFGRFSKYCVTSSVTPIFEVWNRMNLNKLSDRDREETKTKLQPIFNRT